MFPSHRPQPIIRRMPSMTTRELAERLGATLEGAGIARIEGVATLDAAGPTEVTWIAGVKHLPRWRSSQAAAVVAPTGLELPADSRAVDGGARDVLRVGDPELAMTVVLRLFSPPLPQVPTGVDPTAQVAPDARVEGAAIGPRVFVGPGAVIGPRTQLHAGVYVGAGSRIGPDGVLWPNVVIREGVTLGARVVIHPNTTIGADGFGYLFRAGRHLKIPQIGAVVIEDDVEIGANACIDRARTGQTRIGAGTKIDNLVQVAHNVTVGQHCVMAGQVGISGSCRLGDYVVLAGQAGLGDHVVVGDRAILAAQTGVATGEVPAGATFRGTPAKEFAAINREYVALQHLPKLLERMREMEKLTAGLVEQIRRLERREPAADDSTRS